MKQIEILLKLKELYIEATLINDPSLKFNYCMDNQLQYGLCNAMTDVTFRGNYTILLGFDYPLLEELLTKCCKELTDKMYDNHYYWPTLKGLSYDHYTVDFYKLDINHLCLLPRIKAIDLMIKHLSNEQ